jgi:hypothetical protein
MLEVYERTHEKNGNRRNVFPQSGLRISRTVKKWKEMSCTFGNKPENRPNPEAALSIQTEG